MESVAVIAIEVAEHTLPFFELDRREVGHIPCDDLVFEEGQLFGNGGRGEVVFVFEIIVGMYGVVVFFDVGFIAEEGEVVDA